MRLPGALVLVSLFVAVPVGAQERDPDFEGPSGRRWYGWQVMAADLAAIGLLGAAIGTNHGPAPAVLASLGAATFLLVPPLLHLEHGSPGDARASFLLRAVPVVLGIVGGVLVARTQDCTEGCGALVLPVVGLAGSVVGMVIDWAALSTEPAPRLSFAPVLGASGRTAGLGFSLRF